MAQRLEYTKAHHLSTLHDELVAANIHPIYMGDKPGTANGIDMDVADDQDEAAVAAVVAAHNRAGALAAWQAARDAETTEDGQGGVFLGNLDAAIAAWPTATNAQKIDAVLLALRGIRLLLRYELRRRGA